ncbi:MAG TPA: hypothetical protein VFN35_17215, partial [Ktedonobacteraceae bacterium]|nr:hypothetical protein [Ktedonobacteraceae bacterium]
AIVLHSRYAYIESFQKSGFHTSEKLHLFSSMKRATHFSPHNFSPWQADTPRINKLRLAANSRVLIVCSPIGERTQPSISKGEWERLNQQHGEREWSFPGNTFR